MSASPQLAANKGPGRVWLRKPLRLLERRLPSLTRRTGAQSLPVQLDRRGIYILPTRFGIGFALMLMLMMAGALNYANNAALLLTCLLGAACVGSMIGTVRNLEGLQLRRIRVGTTHAGEPIPLWLEFAAAKRARLAIELRAGAQFLPLSITNGNSTVAWSLPTVQRGWLRVPGVGIRSTWPFGLFRAWSWIRPQQSVLIYPRPENHGPAPGQDPASHSDPAPGGDELAALRTWRSGDALKLIAWKASARHHELLAREFERPRVEHEWRLDWSATSMLAPEARIARLARWVTEAHDSARTWSLALPAQTLGPASGSEHFHRCMSALAQLP